MNPELRDRSFMVGLLLIAWAVLVYLKTVLNASVLPDLNAIIAQVQVLMGGVVGYHVGTGAGQPGAPFVQAPAPPAQTGFASLRMLGVLASIALGLVLTGCAGLNAQGVLTITYNTPAATTSATLAPGVQALAPVTAASGVKP